MIRQRLIAGAVATASLCLCTAANAADMPIKGPRMPAPIYYNWTGFYIGGNGGWAWGTSSWVDDPALGGTDLGSHRPSGGLLGGQLGYNLQTGNWVIGIDADIDWASINAGHVDPLGHDINTKVTALGTATGRIGYAQNQFLFYAKGGLAWGQFKYADFITPGGTFNGGKDTTRAGWTIGGGVEYGFAPNWSARVEYNYMDFGRDRMTFSGGAGGAYVQDITESFHVVKAGVNYRFRP